MQAFRAGSWKIESLTSDLQGKLKDHLNRFNRSLISAVRLFPPFNHFNRSLISLFFTSQFRLYLH